MDQEPEIDWSLTTWEGVRREQLRRNLRLTLAERFRALDDLATLSRHVATIGKRSAVPSDTSKNKTTR
jgi:hypothetical protein